MGNDKAKVTRQLDRVGRVRTSAMLLLGLLSNRWFRPRMRADSAAPAVVLSPHLDDAVLSCWSVIGGGESVRVVNVLAGPPGRREPEGWDVACGARDAHAHWQARVAEDGRALARAGVEPLNLSFTDWQYRQEDLPPTLAAVDRALTDAVPRASLVYAPATLGHRHPDHLLARAYALRLLSVGVPVRLYADLPYSAQYGWPSWVTGKPSGTSEKVDVGLRETSAEITNLDTPEAWEVRRLPPAQAEAKRVALRCYETQFEALDRAFPGVLRDEDIYGYELFFTPGAGGRRTRRQG